MKTEETVLDQNVENQSGEETAQTVASSENKQSLKGVWKTVTIGGVTGLVLGTGAGFVANEALAAEPNPEPIPDPNPTPHLNTVHDNPLVVDHNIAEATCVDDRMTFSQAFAAARAEVGSGGVFEWHGNLYNTYTAEEWNSMTAEQRADYDEHFAWHQAHEEEPVHADVVQHNTPHHEVHDAPQAEVVSYGVVHNEENGTNVGMINVDDHDVVFVDTDDDHVFDYAVADANNNGQIDDGEVVDVSEQQITVEHLGGFVGGDPGMMLAEEENAMDEGEVYEG